MASQSFNRTNVRQWRRSKFIVPVRVVAARIRFGPLRQVSGPALGHLVEQCLDVFGLEPSQYVRPQDGRAQSETQFRQIVLAESHVNRRTVKVILRSQAGHVCSYTPGGSEIISGTLWVVG